MTHIPEVLEVMEGGDSAASKKSEKVIRLPYIIAFPLSLVFLLCLLVSSVLIYKYLSCFDASARPKTLDVNEIGYETINEIFKPQQTKDVRLPKSIRPDTYHLKIVPFLWEGKYRTHSRSPYSKSTRE